MRQTVFTVSNSSIGLPATPQQILFEWLCFGAIYSPGSCNIVCYKCSHNTSDTHPHGYGKKSNVRCASETG